VVRDIVAATMPHYDVQALAVVRAYYRVWVEGSHDPVELELAAQARRGGRRFHAALGRLMALGLVRNGPPIYGGGIAWEVLPAGEAVLRDRDLEGGR